MDAVWLYVLLAFVVVVPLVWALVGRRVRAVARAAGTAAGLNLEARVAASTAKGLERDAALLGTRLRLPAGAGPVVASALAAATEATDAGDGRWSIAHGTPDMLTAVWRDEPDGTGTFLAVRARQSFGTFLQTRTWTKLLDRIAAATTAQGLTASTETVPLVPSSESVDGDPVWVAAAEG